MRYKLNIELTGSSLANRGELEVLLSYGLITSYKQRKTYDEYYFEAIKVAELSLEDLMALSRDFDMALTNFNYLSINI
jgi:actin-related protein